MIPRKYQDLSENQKEFSVWLNSFDFDTFGTFTTARTLTLPGCRRMAGRFYREFPQIEMFWAAEPFSIRTGYHFHALIKTGENGFLFHDRFKDYSRVNMFEYWTNFKQFGRSDFQPIKKEFGENWTAEYITKYISKGLSDYDIITPGMPAEKPDPISHYKPHRFINHKIKSAPKYTAEIDNKLLREARREHFKQLKIS